MTHIFKTTTVKDQLSLAGKNGENEEFYGNVTHKKRFKRND